MRHLPKVGLYIAALILLASCTKDNPTNFTMEKPESIAVQDSLNSNFSMLKTYVDTLDSNFKLGVGASSAVYADQGAMYGLINSNFQEIAMHGMGHGTVVQSNGSLNLDGMNSILGLAQQTGISVHGGALLSIENENEAYLNRIIGPDTVSTGGPAWTMISSANFETDDASNYQSNAGAATSFTAEGEGANGEGRALAIHNETVRTNDYDSQFFITFDPHTQAGDRYRFRMDVRADQAATFPTQAHDQPGGYLHWDFFGQINATTEWSEHDMQINVSPDQVGAGTIAFNLGATATTYYFDNMEVWYLDEEGGVITEEKTPEEKQQIITTELESYVSTMVDTVSNVTTWDVLDGAIAGGSESSFELKSSGNFNWQDHLGEEYGVQAFQVAREHAGDDLLFINDTGLEILDKAHGLINYVEYIENNGATVDGIGTHLDITINTSEQNITDMFELLAATGKMVRISGLSVGLGGIGAGSASSEVYQAQADMYQFVVEEYFSIVPEDQRYGITIWNPVDSANNPVGLWNVDYERKRAYAGFSTGIMNGFNSGN